MKNIFLAVLAITAMAACTEKEDVFQPDSTLNTSGTVNLCASIEDIDSKMTMDASGKGMWVKGDKIAVSCSDGTFVEFELNGTGETKRAVFTGTIPEGKELGNIAVWPTAAVVGYEGENLKLRLPDEYYVDDIAFDGVMVASISDSWEILFKHTAARLTLQLSNVPSYASSIELSADGYSLGGIMSLDNDRGELTGKGGTQALTVHLNTDEQATSVSFTVNVPAAEYQEIKATVYDGDTEVTAQTINERPVTGYRAGHTTLAAKFNGTFEKFDPVVVDYVEVAGVKWAKGNLQFEKDRTETGFRPNWSISSSQWHYFEYEKTEAYTAEHNGGTAAGKAYNESNPTRQDMINDYNNRYDHFNFGGISNPWSRSYEDHCAVEDSDISGKIYIDRECKTEAPSFVDAEYGDIAYWASNGYYRMPTHDEWQALLDNASIQYGYVMTEAGVKVWGCYYSDPEPGVQPETNTDATVEITVEDLEKGLFLPNAGRKAFATDEYCINARLDGFYWCGYGGSDKSSASSYSEDYYAELLYNNISDKNIGKNQFFSTKDASVKGSYNRRNCYCIRPVVNDSHSQE